MNRAACALAAAALAAFVLVACSGSDDETSSGVTSVCDPAMRFRLAGIEYEGVGEVVPTEQLDGPYGDPLVLDPDTLRCVPGLVLADGEGALPTGTQAQRIAGVDPVLGLAASIDGTRYLRFSSRPDPAATGELGETP